ncbi:MAG: TIGR00180 family glycosyltransferase [Desulfomonilaceae bacterium]
MNQSLLESWAVAKLANKKSEDASYSEALSKLTIVIPSYDRQPFLLRQAVYWGYSKATMIIVDGSLKPINQSTKRIIDDLPNVKYLYMADSIAKRLRLAFQFVETPYSIMLGDDDFFLKKGLSKAVEKLEKNDGLAACTGQTLAFDFNHDDLHTCYFKSYNYKDFEVTNATASDRLAFAISRYNAATCYAVLRQNVMRRWIETTKDWSLTGANEIHQAFTTYIHGKLSTVPNLFWLRSSENPMVSVSGWDRSLTWREWCTSDQFSEEYKSFVKIVSEELSEYGKIHRQDSRKIIIEAITPLLALETSSRGSTYINLIRRSVRDGVIQSLRKILSQNYFQQLKRFYGQNKCAHSLNNAKYDELERYIKSQGLAQLDAAAFEELKEIESIISEFHGALR